MPQAHPAINSIGLIDNGSLMDHDRASLIFGNGFLIQGFPGYSQNAAYLAPLFYKAGANFLHFRSDHIARTERSIQNVLRKCHHLGGGQIVTSNSPVLNGWRYLVGS